tara:strand:+ start:9342 stop:9686 length:345 start_codon:yes stop_codon:yes gene_type:complete
MASNQKIWSILAMTTIWLVILTSKINNLKIDVESANKRVNVLEVKSIIEEDMPEVIEKDSEDTSRDLTPFEQIFKEMRNNYGSGVVFNWNGDDYTTNYLEEIKTENGEYRHVRQ